MKSISILPVMFNLKSVINTGFFISRGINPIPIESDFYFCHTILGIKNTPFGVFTI